MPWQAPILAHVDRLGHLICIDCEPELAEQEQDAGGYPSAVHGDAYFCPDDKCHRCGNQLEHVPISKYVKVS